MEDDTSSRKADTLNYLPLGYIEGCQTIDQNSYINAP